MMKRVFTKIYAWVLLILLTGRFLWLILSAWQELDCFIEAVVGVATAVVFVPAFHELGHIAFACIHRMKIVGCKCFCFRYSVENGRKRMGFANPFAPDETQVMPMGSEDMEKRAYVYTMGGLVASALIFMMLVIGCTQGWVNGKEDYVLSAWLFYAAYIFLLNVLPAEYVSGKTDLLIALGIKKGEAVEQTMLNLMRIHGALQEGKSFSEADTEWYFSAPQIAEDEPLYVAILEARYSYYLEIEDYENAFDCLKRIKAAGEYLSEQEILALERNLAYLCLLGGNDEVLKAAVKNDEAYWKSEDVAIKRTLALYMQKCGETERAQALISQAEKMLENTQIAGLKKHEEILLSRIK